MYVCQSVKLGVKVEHLLDIRHEQWQLQSLYQLKNVSEEMHTRNISLLWKYFVLNFQASDHSVALSVRWHFSALDKCHAILNFFFFCENLVLWWTINVINSQDPLVVKVWYQISNHHWNILHMMTFAITWSLHWSAWGAEHDHVCYQLLKNYLWSIDFGSR